MAAKESLLDVLGGSPSRRATRQIYGKAGAEAGLARAARLSDSSGLAGRRGALILSSPGRTELGGNHTDHNDGRVLAAAVRLDALAVCAPRDDMLAEIRSAGYPDTIRVDLSSLDPLPSERETTAALVRGAAKALSAKGFRIGGFDAAIESAVPAGSGLSSSACIEVLIGGIFSHLYNGGEIDWIDLALAGRFAENEHFGKPCGLMDQMACAGGGVMAIDFRDPDKPAWKRLPIEGIEGGDWSLAIVRTGGSHADLTRHYAAIPEEMRAAAAMLGRPSMRGIGRKRLLEAAGAMRGVVGDRAIQRALHFVDENKRVRSMASALERGRMKRYLRLVRESGTSSRTLLQNVDAGLDPRSQGVCLALALSEACLGSRGATRVHGGGFAGTIQAYVPRGLEEKYGALMESAFGKGCVSYPGLRPVGLARLA